MMKSFLKDPLFHLFGIGCLLYGLFFWLNGNDPVSVDISKAIGEKLQRYEHESPNPLTLDQRNQFIIENINEELLYREARRVGLDHDGFIRERLVQKARFYIEGQFIPSDVDEEALQLYYSSNQANYKKQKTVSFEQRLLNAAGVSQINEILAQAPAEQEFLEKIKSLQQPSLLSSVFDNASIEGVKEIFGEEFIESLMELPLNQWKGFIESEQGFHVVKLLSKEEDRFSEFSEIKEKVKQDWVSAQKELWLQQYLESLRKQYDIQFEGYIAHE